MNWLYNVITGFLMISTLLCGMREGKKLIIDDDDTPIWSLKKKLTSPVPLDIAYYVLQGEGRNPWIQVGNRKEHTNLSKLPEERDGIVLRGQDSVNRDKLLEQTSLKSLLRGQSENKIFIPRAEYIKEEEGQDSLIKKRKKEPLVVEGVTYFKQNSTTIFVGKKDGSVEFYDRKTGNLVQKVHVHASPIIYLDVTDDGKELVVTTREGISVWECNKVEWRGKKPPAQQSPRKVYKEEESKHRRNRSLDSFGDGIQVLGRIASRALLDSPRNRTHRNQRNSQGLEYSRSRNNSLSSTQGGS